MFCGNCGKKNEEGARFCEFCGTPLLNEAEGRSQEPAQDSAQPFTEQNQYGRSLSGEPVREQQTQQGQEGETLQPAQQKRPSGKKGKRWIWGIAAAAVLITALIIAGILIFRDRQEKQRYQNALASGDRYLEEMDYEKAEDSYLEAISIDPKQKEPYLGLVDTYVAMEDYDRAVKTAEEAKAVLPEEDQQEFDDIIQKWSNVIEYTWAVEPEIEAEDITYIQSGDLLSFSANEREKQKDSEYAVIVQDGLFGIIRSDGTVVVEPEYTDISEYYGGVYLMRRAEPQYESSVNSGWDLYFFDEETEEITMAEGLGSGPDPMGAYYYCGGLHNINEAYIYLDYQFKEPDSPIPVQQSDDIFESSDGYYGYWLQGMYAVYSDGVLTTDFIYEECGSESDGVLAAKKDGKWGYITADGTEVIPFEYDSSWQIFSGDEEISYCYAASEGYIPLVKDGMWEMRDTAGNVVIPAGVFEAIRPVNGGKCWVQKNGKWGVIQLETDAAQPEEPEDSMDDEDLKEPQTEVKSEEELRAVLEGNTSDLIVNFEYDDYDGDGVSEAFGITSPEDYDELGLCGDVGVWFIDCEGNCTQLMSDTYGYLHQQKVPAGQQKFIVWEMSGGGSGSLSYIFGIRDGSPYEPQISGQYMQFETAKYDDTVYVGQTSDFSMGYHNYIITEFVFDSDSGEFVEN